MLGYFPNLPYHVAVIGAASGIGRETASFLGKQGVSLACIDRNLAGAEEAWAMLEKEIERFLPALAARVNAD